MSAGHSDMMKADFARRRAEKDQVNARILEVARGDLQLDAADIGQRFGKTRQAINHLLKAHGLLRKPDPVRLVARRRRSA